MPYAGFSSGAYAFPGDSFVSPDGVNWTDICEAPGYSSTNVCLKAYSTP